MFTNPGSVSSIYKTDIDYLANIKASTVDSSLHTKKSTTFRYVNQMANAFYRNKLDTIGSKLDIGYSYISYGLRDPSALETEFLNGNGAESHPRDSLFTKTIGKSMVHVANIDLEKHLFKLLVFNTGSKFTASNTDYSMDYRNGLNEQSPLDPLKSNRFLYSEYILAFYGTVAKSFKQWDFKVGIRTEQTNYHGKSVTTEQTIGRNQWNFFPSAFLNRKFGENHSLTLSYNRTIDRPGFRQLNIHGTEALNRSKFIQYVRTASKFNLPRKYFVEVSGFYKTSDFYGIYDQQRVGKLDINIKKSFLSDRLTSSFELQDPFHLYKPRYEINTAEFTRNVLRNRLDFVRYIGVFFTYNFSSGKKQDSKENVDAAGNEARGRL